MTSEPKTAFFKKSFDASGTVWTGELPAPVEEAILTSNSFLQLATETKFPHW